MDRQMTTGNYEVAKKKEKGRNIFSVSLSLKNVSNARSIETKHSFTEWSEREATKRYNSLIRFARKNP